MIIMLVGTKKNQRVTGFVPDDGNEYFFTYLIMGTPTLRIVTAIRTINNENALTMTSVTELMRVKLKAAVITFLFRLMPITTTF